MQLTDYLTFDITKHITD